MDATYLCKCMTAFRKMFNELKILMDRAISVDPFLLITTAVTFDGIYGQFFLKKVC